MRPSLIRFTILALIAVFTLPFTAQAADENSDLKSLQDKLRKANPKLADEFEKRLQQSLGEVNQFQRGHIIFGRIEVEAGQDPRAVVSQMIILQDGYFVDAIGAAGRPVGFRLSGYESAIVTPEGPGPVEDLGTISLKPLPPDRLCSATGRLKVDSHPGAPKLENLTVSWDLPADPINTPHNGTEGTTGFH